MMILRISERCRHFWKRINSKGRILKYFYNLSVYLKLAFLVFVTVSFLCLTAFFTTNYIASKKNDLMFEELLQGVILANEGIISEFVLTNNSWQLYKFLKSLQDNSPLLNYAAFINTRQEVLAHTQSELYPVGTEYIAKNPNTLKFPINHRGLSLGYIELQIEQKSFLNQIADAFFLSLLFIFASGIFSFLLSNYFIHKLLDRLLVLKGNTRAIADKKWDEIVKYKGKDNDEITEIILTTESLMYEIKESISNIEKQKNFYHHILESVDSLIVICDENFRVLYHNTHHLGKCILNADQSLLDAKILKIVSMYTTEEKKSFSLPLDCFAIKSLEDALVLVNFQNIDDKIVYTFADLTSVKQENDSKRIIESLKFLSDISSSFAHQIKNLIQPLRLLLDQDEIPDKEDIIIIHKTIVKIDSQILNYLTLRKPIEPYENTPLFLSETIESTRLLYKNLLKKKKLDLINKVPKEIEVHMHIDSMDLMLTNLLKNAIEASLENSQILFEWSTFDKYLGLLSVTNSCNTISSDEKKQFFKPFFTTKKDGNGLGLFTIYRIIYLCGGRIQVKTTHNSVTFNIYIPTVAAPIIQSKGDF